MNVAKSIRVLTIAIAMLAGFALSHAALAQVSIGISVGFAPPELPVYEQPLCPGEGYLWTPGYWAWDPDYEDYYWVPGTWVEAPQPGYLWTPAWWGWGGNAYLFHEGYWGPRVGFYGGIDYGYGYTGRGYEGGRWEGRQFYYNRSVNNVTNVRNVYNTTIVNNVNVTRVSYNGGRGGVNVRETRQEEAASRERHMGSVAAQNQQIQAARSNRELRASENHGRPPIAATSRPGSFNGGGVVAARQGGNYNPPANRGGNDRNRGANNGNRPGNESRPVNEANRPGNNNRPENNTNRAENNRPSYVHPNDLPKTNRPDRPPNSGNPKTDQKYQQQQQKMYQKQDQDRQKLQQRQDQEHQRMTQQKANDQRQQQVEQHHQQQTQQMAQKQEHQQQKMEQRQQPRSQQQQQKPQQQQQHQNQDKKPN
jgi:hypothetical protein